VVVMGPTFAIKSSEAIKIFLSGALKSLLQGLFILNGSS
jgi:hypothetical protein